MILCYTEWIINDSPAMFILILRKFDFTDTFWTFWKLNWHVLYFKLFIYVSVVSLYYVNTAVSCQLQTSTKLILIRFQNIIFEKEVLI